MNNQCRKLMVLVLCVSVLANSACITTTQRVGASQAAMNNYGVEQGDFVLVRYANIDDPRSSSRSESIRIARIDEKGISGFGENGEVVDASYDEIYQIEYKKAGLAKSDSPALKGAANAAETTSKVLIKGLAVVACVVAASGGVACP